MAIGLPVAVRFEQHDDVWLPVFAPTGEPASPRMSTFPEPRPGPGSPPWSDDREVRVSGGPHRDRHVGGGASVGPSIPLSLAIDACRAAVADAGLTMDDIDGLSTYPGGGAKDGGHSEGGIYPVAEALGIAPTWFCGTMETPGQSGAVVNAMLAVAAGLCRHVLCFRTVWETTSIAWGNRQQQRGGRRPGSDVG